MILLKYPIRCIASIPLSKQRLVEISYSVSERFTLQKCLQYKRKGPRVNL
jgi:hypothetical protein